MEKFMPSLFWGGLYALFFLIAAVAMLISFFATYNLGFLFGGLVMSSLCVLMLRLLKCRKQELDEEKERQTDYDNF